MGIRLLVELSSQSFGGTWLLKTWRESRCEFVLTLSHVSLMLPKRVDWSFLKGLHRLHFWVFIEVICCVNCSRFGEILPNLLISASTTKPGATNIQTRFRIFKEHSIRGNIQIITRHIIQVGPFRPISLVVPPPYFEIAFVHDCVGHLMCKLDHLGLCSRCIQQLLLAKVMES